MKSSDPNELAEVATWVNNQEETDYWCGGKVMFPIDLSQCIEAIEWNSAINRTIVVDQEVVAFGQILFRPGNRRHLARLIVHPGRRGSGFGKMLVGQLIDEALSQNPIAISLFVDPHNERAIALYLKLGFRAIREPNSKTPSPFMYMVYAN